jgi:hypothetical protein
LAKAAGQQPRDPLDDDAAGELTGFFTAHAVAHGKNEIGGREGSPAGFSEIPHLMTVERQREKRVFVIRAEPTAIRQRRPL